MSETKAKRPRKRKPYTDTAYMRMEDGSCKPIVSISCDEYGNKTITKHMDDDEREQYVEKMLENMTRIINV